MYRVRGAHNAVKLDRFTSSLSNTLLSTTSTSQDNTSSTSLTKRKHAIDSTSTTATSTVQQSSSKAAERKRASESSLLAGGVNLKRSLSAENPTISATTKDGRKSSDSENTLPVGITRRCASALPADNSTRRRDNLASSTTANASQISGNLTSTSLPNVATSTSLPNVAMDTNKVNKKLERGSSCSSEEYVEIFENLNLAGTLPSTSPVPDPNGIIVELTEKQASHEIGSSSESFSSVETLNENDLD